jgi:hypothetical protein
MRIVQTTPDLLVSPTVEVDGDGSSIGGSELGNFNVEIGDVSIDSSGVVPKETVTLKITPSSTSPVNPTVFRGLLQNAIQLNYDYTNFSVDIKTPLHSSQVETKNLNKTIASWDVFTNFQFLSNNYDELSSAFKETEMPSIATKAQMSQFLDGEVSLYLENPGDMSNYVYPTQMKSSNASGRLSNFPFYNQIKITNKVSNDFSNFLNKTDLFESTLSAYLNGEKMIADVLIQSSTQATTAKIEAFDLLKWAEDFYTPTAESDLTNLFETEMSSGNYELGYDKQEPSSMDMDFYRLLMIGKIRSLTTGANFRRFQEVLANSSCYKEDFVYSIEKFRNTAAKMQNIYVPAVDDTSIVNDTQIRYGETYIYKCSGHYIIVGNKYRYLSVQYSNPGTWAEVTVENTPHVVIIPIEMFEEKAKVIQPPPLSPQVKIKTKNNSSNEIQIRLAPTKGQQFLDFQQITSEDHKQYAMMLENRRSGASKFRFKTNLDSGLYEIFKMSTPPRSYSDFASKRLATVRMDYMNENVLFSDNIIPNQKYYYLFRKVNAKGLVSNPTSIYEVELLRDADDSKIVMDTYEMVKPIKSKKRRKFKQLFQITPAVEHVMFDEQQPALYGKTTMKDSLDSLEFGTADPSVWGRKFKFRIRSTTTGKIIDYNITFQLTKNKTEEDFN